MTLQEELAGLQNLPRRGATDGTPAPLAQHDSSIIHTYFSVAALGDNVLVAPQNSKFDVVAFKFWNAQNEVTITLTDGTVTLDAFWLYPARAGYTLGYAPDLKPWFTVPAGNPFVLNLPVATLVHGWVKYRLVS